MTSRKVGTASASRPSGAILRPLNAFIENDERHIADGVRGVGHVVFEIPHLFEVAVVGQDHGRAAELFDLVEDFSDAGIDGLGGLDRRREHAGVADHVRVGKVDDDDIVLAAIEPLENLIADSNGAHLGLEGRRSGPSARG